MTPTDHQYNDTIEQLTSLPNTGSPVDDIVLVALGLILLGALVWALLTNR